MSVKETSDKSRRKIFTREEPGETGETIEVRGRHREKGGRRTIVAVTGLRAGTGVGEETDLRLRHRSRY